MNPVVSDQSIIQVRDLTKNFKRFIAVDRISFDIQPGEILGFLGPNGAGKTTTIKMIMGLLRVSSGTILVKGLDSQSQRRQIKRVLGYMSQKFSLYPLLNGYENIEFFAGISGLKPKLIRLRQREMERDVDKEILRLKVQDIPPGIRQKIALFVCLLSEPEIILLDEPTSGVDPEVRRQFWMEIYQLKKAGKTILVTTHNLDEAEYADRIIVIHRGQIILQGEPQALARKHGSGSIEELFKEAVRDRETP